MCRFCFVLLPQASPGWHLCDVTISKEDLYLKCMTILLSIVFENCISKSPGKHGVLKVVHYESVSSFISMKNVSFNLWQWLHELPQQQKTKAERKKERNPRNRGKVWYALTWICV